VAGFLVDVFVQATDATSTAIVRDEHRFPTRRVKQGARGRVRRQLAGTAPRRVARNPTKDRPEKTRQVHRDILLLRLRWKKNARQLAEEDATEAKAE